LHADDRSDEELFAAFVAGDGRAFTPLMQRHEDRIFALAMKMTGDRNDALDATQETFVTAFRRAHQFRGESAFATWLYRIGINACHDVLRKRKRTPDPVEEPQASETLRVEAVDEGVALRIDLARALAALPSEYREAVTLHDLGGLSYEEIARVGGTKLGTVKSRISRGRRLLAAALEQPAPTPPSKEVEA
jgi:RNA polymerase sigma-70 factor, ECF subfamily